MEPLFDTSKPFEVSYTCIMRSGESMERLQPASGQTRFRSDEEFSAWVIERLQMGEVLTIVTVRNLR